ncbi:metallophosphoesterase [Rhizobium sp.]|jgi:3',5'-cyclic AMP phosphodiesterase CpdA|uniref:metallophosphoesterase family protein n=1 Tax=Rhizobium sp. TaxID=391 RepID=UPI000E8F9D76|nr:metallophosphoesterase [Rhizobium sp.]
MQHTHDFSLAIIADAHFHDIDGDYGVPGVTLGARSLTLRSWADSRASTRVFNESAMALDAALKAIVARNIHHVVLLGDYTDDGQRTTTANAAKLFKEHEARHGTRFYALPGNHDIFGPKGRHQAKRFLQADGSSLLVTSDVSETAPNHIVNPAMYCEGYPLGLAPMAAFGYFRRSDYLYWETPFGLSDDPLERTYKVSSQDGQNLYSLMDASYLVEPEDGFWLLMLDANVFEPRDGVFPIGSEQAFIDSTAAGWNAMLRLKPFIVEWMADVATRAKQLGKTLLAFSHYPAIDPFDDPEGTREVLFPNSTMTKRKPSDAVANALIAAGIPVHFSGHLHVEGVSLHNNDDGQLVNVAVPSLVAFPPAFKHLKIGKHTVAVETVDLAGLPMDADIISLYRRETALLGYEPDKALAADTYGQFLRLHTAALVIHRYFPTEWPSDIVTCLAPMSLEQLCLDERTRPNGMDANGLAILCQQGQLSQQDLAQLSIPELVSDWYCLSQAASLALPVLGEQRLKLLHWVADLYCDANNQAEETTVSVFLRVFFQALRHFLNRAKSPVEAISLFD